MTPRLVQLVLLLSSVGTMVHAFVPSAVHRVPFAICSVNNNSPSSTSPDLDREINEGLEKAKSLLKKSKAKLEKNEQAAAIEAAVPFFATSKRTVSRQGVVKSIDEATGLVTADGERMAAVSEAEDWEFRTLDDVFQNEMGSKEDVYSVASKQLADRDVAASMYNLRKELHNEDYRRIFDKRNRFIGEDS